MIVLPASNFMSLPVSQPAVTSASMQLQKYSKQVQYTQVLAVLLCRRSYKTTTRRGWALRGRGPAAAAAGRALASLAMALRPMCAQMTHLMSCAAATCTTFRATSCMLVRWVIVTGRHIQCVQMILEIFRVHVGCKP